MRASLTCLLSLCCLLCMAQDRTFPSLEASRWVGDFKHDGELNEACWNTCAIAGDFTAHEPTPNVKPKQKSEVMVAYDDEFLYIGARLYDQAPDSILHQLTSRDDIGNTDWFVVSISPYQDGINGFEFFVTPEGVLVDSRVSANNQDWGWDAVWMAKASINEEGWVAEYRIPFSAIRFPQKEEQVWDINFTRSVRRTRENSAWSFVDPQVAGFFNQAGQLKGIRGV